MKSQDSVMAQTDSETQAETGIFSLITGLITKATKFLLDPAAEVVHEFIFDTTKPFTDGFVDNVENVGTLARGEGQASYLGGSTNC